MAKYKEIELNEEKGPGLMEYAKIIELITERSEKDRKESFIEISENIYQYIDELGTIKGYIVINDTKLKDDIGWLKGRNINLELACEYLKKLEERYYEIIVKTSEIADRISAFSHALNIKNFPQYKYIKEDSEEEENKKVLYRIVSYNKYKEMILEMLAISLEKKLQNKKNENSEDTKKDEIKLKNEIKLKGENLGNKIGKPEFVYIESKKEGYKKYLDKISKHIDKVIIEQCNKIGEDEINYKTVYDQKISQHNEQSERVNKGKARRTAYMRIFSYLEPQYIESWIELIFTKFYHELNNRKPGKGRKEWLNQETKKWFENHPKRKNVWKFTKEAVNQLLGIVDEKDRIDLLNYNIVLKTSALEEIEKEIKNNSIDKEILDREVGFCDRSISRRLSKSVGIIEPFVACLFWKKCNITFDSLFLIEGSEMTNDEEKFRSVCEEVIEKDPKTNTERMFALEKYKKNFNKEDFWYTPMMDKPYSDISIDLSEPEVVTLTVEYSSFIEPPYVIKIPYSGAMKRILRFDDEQVQYIANETGCETKEEIFEKSAEIMTRKFCEIFLGIPYSEYKRILNSYLKLCGEE